MSSFIEGARANKVSSEKRKLRFTTQTTRTTRFLQQFFLNANIFVLKVG